MKPDTPGKFPFAADSPLSSHTTMRVLTGFHRQASREDLDVSLITHTSLVLSPHLPPTRLLPLPPSQLSMSGLPMMMTTQVDVSSVLTMSCEEMYQGVRDLV